jgi:hypothetical protein
VPLTLEARIGAGADPCCAKTPGAPLLAGTSPDQATDAIEVQEQTEALTQPDLPERLGYEERTPHRQTHRRRTAAAAPSHKPRLAV